MLEPVDGMDRLVSLLDEVTCDKPTLPALVVVATSTDPVLNAQFLADLKARLSGSGDNALVPHAHADRNLAESAATSGLTPYAAMLDLLVQKLRSHIPRGAGGNWKAVRFQLVQDILAADGEIGAARRATQRAGLLALLYQRWESRNTLLGWARGMSQSGLPVRLVGTLLAAILSSPLKWLYTRRLNGRSTRWLRDSVQRVTGNQGDFASQALSLLAIGDLGEERLDHLRRQILVKAVLEDLSDLMRPGRLSPRRRRRRWTPVLLLDGAQPRVAALLHEFAAQMKDLAPAPLLIVGTLDLEHTARMARTTHTVPDAATTLNRFVNGDRAALPMAPYLAVRLPVAGEQAAAENPAVRTWVASHRHVTPQVPGLSAVAPLAVVVALLAGAVVFGGYLWASATADTATLSFWARASNAPWLTITTVLLFASSLGALRLNLARGDRKARVTVKKGKDSIVGGDSSKQGEPAGKVVQVHSHSGVDVGPVQIQVGDLLARERHILSRPKDDLARLLLEFDRVEQGLSVSKEFVGLELERQIYLERLLSDSSVYISGNDPTAVLAALTELGEAYGFTVEPIGKVERGSWFRRFRLRWRQHGGNDKLADIAGKLERVAELHAIHQVRSQNDEREANAVARLIETLGDDDAVIKLSSLLVIKVDGNIVARVLTEDEIKLLSSSPALLSDPRAILDALTRKLPQIAADEPADHSRLDRAVEGAHRAELED